MALGSEEMTSEELRAWLSVTNPTACEMHMKAGSAGCKKHFNSGEEFRTGLLPRGQRVDFQVRSGSEIGLCMRVGGCWEKGPSSKCDYLKNVFFGVTQHLVDFLGAPASRLKLCSQLQFNRNHSPLACRGF